MSFQQTLVECDKVLARIDEIDVRAQRVRTVTPEEIWVWLFGLPVACFAATLLIWKVMV